MSILHHQFVRYGIVGTFSVMVDFFVLNITYLYMNFSLFWSVFTGFTLSILIGYFFHSRWTFRYDTNGKEVVKFASYLVMTLTALAITEGVVYIATLKYGLYYNYSKAIALILAITFTYIMSKYWIFSRNHQLDMSLPTREIS